MYQDPVPPGISENSKGQSGYRHMNEGRGLRVKIADLDRGRSYTALWVVLLIYCSVKKQKQKQNLRCLKQQFVYYDYVRWLVLLLFMLAWSFSCI